MVTIDILSLIMNRTIPAVLDMNSLGVCRNPVNAIYIKQGREEVIVRYFYKDGLYRVVSSVWSNTWGYTSLPSLTDKSYTTLYEGVLKEITYFKSRLVDTSNKLKCKSLVLKTMDKWLEDNINS